MGCSLFANYHFQMGVTVMGFAEDSRHSKCSYESLGFVKFLSACHFSFVVVETENIFSLGHLSNVILAALTFAV